MKAARIVIVSPALADANNGNWQTARRWQQLLTPHHFARITREWPDSGSAQDQVMLALHARRSAPSIAAWVQQHGNHGLAVVLTGTDLYRDVAIDQSAQQSLASAQALVVLQERGLDAVPVSYQSKARVLFQSTRARATIASKTTRHLRVLMVGHLRTEKDPATLMAAACLLSSLPDISIDHIGAPLEEALGRAAELTENDCPHYRWLGAVPHEATRKRMQRAHVLVHTSVIEGGAHVVMEAACSGTPVIASRIPGNVGMLGADYEGYFPPGDAPALASLLRQARTSQQQPGGLLARLTAQCMLRSQLFSPAAERQGLLDLIATLQTNDPNAPGR